MVRQFLAAVFLFAIAHSANAQRLAFIRGNEVLAGSAAGGRFLKVAHLGGHAARGDDRQLSKDGKSIAYTFSVTVKRPAGSLKPDFDRYVEISRLDGSELRRLADPPENNAFGPVWSPDGESVAFNCLYRSPTTQSVEWGIAVAKQTLQASTRLTNPVFNHGYFVFSWTPEGTIAALGNDTLHILDRSGKILQSVPLTLDTLGATEFSPSSADVISISPDGRFMLWIVDGADDGSGNFERMFEEDLYGIMMVYDRETKTLRRISPKTIAVNFERPVWLPGQTRIIFCGIEAKRPIRKSEHPSTDLFEISLDGSSLRRIERNAHAPALVE